MRHTDPDTVRLLDRFHEFDRADQLAGLPLPIARRRRVTDAVDELANTAWSSREDKNRLGQVTEIRRLAREQLADDVWTITSGQRDRVGRAQTGRVVSSWGIPEGKQHPLWQQRSDRDRALELALAPFLNRLDGDELVVVRDFMSGKSIREIAATVPWSKDTVQRKQRSAFDRLRVWLAERYGGEEDRDGLGLGA